MTRRPFAKSFLFLVLATSGLSRLTGTLAADAPPATPPQPSAPSVPGTLMICGGGILPEQVPQKFIELAGGKDAKIVLIPTASRYADSQDLIDRVVAFWRTRNVSSLKVLHTRSRETADDPDFCAPLAEATGVWFGGGNQSNITSVYLGTKTAERLHGLLKRGGVIGGTSAGAAVMSRVMIAGGRADEEPRLGDGMGFLDGAIVDQHFLKRRRLGRLTKAIRTRPNTLGFGIDEGTALVVSGTKLSVVGESEVCVCLPCASAEDPPKVEHLKPGDEADILTYCSFLGAPAPATTDAGE